MRPLSGMQLSLLLATSRMYWFQEDHPTDNTVAAVVLVSDESELSFQLTGLQKGSKTSPIL